MARVVTLVAGPPCVGKSTYVAQHAKPGDLVLDQDVIGAQSMRLGLAQVADMADGTAWVIRCCPGPQRRQAFAEGIRATRVALLAAPEDELVARAARRPNPRRHIQAVRDWLHREAQDAPVAQPRPRLTTTQQGLGWAHQKLRARLLPKAYGTPCPYCHQLMLRGQDLDLDHAVARALGGHDGPRRMAHAHCNRSAGSKLGAALRRARRLPPARTHSRRW